MCHVWGHALMHVTCPDARGACLILSGVRCVRLAAHMRYGKAPLLVGASGRPWGGKLYEGGSHVEVPETHMEVLFSPLFFCICREDSRKGGPRN